MIQNNHKYWHKSIIWYKTCEDKNIFFETQKTKFQGSLKQFSRFSRCFFQIQDFSGFSRSAGNPGIFFVVCIFMIYILTNWYFNTHLTSSLYLADLTFLFIMPVTTICSFWIWECRVLAKASNCYHNLGHFLK